MKLVCHRCGHSWVYRGKRQIATCARCITGVRLRPRFRIKGGWHHTKETRQKLAELRFGEKISLKNDLRSLSYVVGVVDGDGSVRRNSIRLNTTSSKFAKAFYEVLAKLGLRPHLYQFPSQRTKRGKPVFSVIIHSIPLVDFLKSPKKEECALRYPTEYVRGFYESEGFLDRHNVVMAVREKNLTKLHFVEKLLRKLGFRTKMYKLRKKDTNKYGHIFWLYLLGGQRSAQQFMEIIQPSR